MKKILFIEDENDLNLAYRKKFEGLYIVDFASDSVMALQKVEDFFPDLVILDIIIPGEVNGIGVLKEIKSNVKFAKIPILILTNLEGQEETVKNLGAVDCLVKSNTSFDIVAQKIENILSS